jgi:hypothetical protein
VTLRRLAVLQWVGLLLGALMWTAQHLAGLFVTEAACDSFGATRQISNDAWQLSLGAAAIACVLAAQVAAITVLRGTRETSYEAEPPEGRIRFLAMAAAIANALFLVIIVLDTVASTVNPACTQS